MHFHKLKKNKGWYLEDGYMEAVKTKAIRKMVNQLCWEIRPDVSLVKAFDIPDSCPLRQLHCRSYNIKS
jgi:acyl-CoA oxidase